MKIKLTNICSSILQTWSLCLGNSQKLNQSEFEIGENIDNFAWLSTVSILMPLQYLGKACCWAGASYY